jgi:hypothetical protein
MTMNELLQRLAREAGIDRAADLRRHDVQEALPRLAALIAEQCASAACRLVAERAIKGRRDVPPALSSEIAGEIRSVFPPPSEDP